MALYELRAYTLHAGKMAEAVKLYQEIGFPALQKGGPDNKLVGYCQSDTGTINQLLHLHLWKFDDDADRRSHWAAVFAAELHADRPVGVVELGPLGGGEIPVADNLEIRGSLLGNGASFALEIEPGGRPDPPIAAKLPLALEQRRRQQPGEVFRVDLEQSRVVEH